MEQLRLSNKQAPGDVLLMTCAIRELHTQYPGKYVTEVGGSAMDIWNNNPYVQQVNRTLPYKDLHLGYSTAINQCNQRRGHFATGFVLDMMEKLGIKLDLTSLRPDVHLTDKEKSERRVDKPYWVIVAGGKSDFTAKMWDFEFYQRVVEELKDEVTFVQVGSVNHIHKPLKGVINLLGKTTLRELIQVVYHSEGAICPVTCVMHLCGAFNKPCVIIAGGREPWWWEAYNRVTWAESCTTPVPDDLVDHAYLHTMGGDLSCCKNTGCWRSGLGEKKAGANCKSVKVGPSQKQPECLLKITPAMVIESVRKYMKGDEIPVTQHPLQLHPPVYKAAKNKSDKEVYARMNTPRKRYGPKRRGEIRQLLNNHEVIVRQPKMALGPQASEKWKRWGPTARQA